MGLIYLPYSSELECKFFIIKPITIISPRKNGLFAEIIQPLTLEKDPATPTCGSQIRRTPGTLERLEIQGHGDVSITGQRERIRCSQDLDTQTRWRVRGIGHRPYGRSVHSK